MMRASFYAATQGEATDQKKDRYRRTLHACL